MTTKYPFYRWDGIFSIGIHKAAFPNSTFLSFPNFSHQPTEFHFPVVMAATNHHPQDQPLISLDQRLLHHLMLIRTYSLHSLSIHHNHKQRVLNARPLHTLRHKEGHRLQIQVQMVVFLRMLRRESVKACSHSPLNSINN